MRPLEATEDEGTALRQPGEDAFGWPATAESDDFELAPFELQLMLDAAAEQFGSPARDKGVVFEMKAAATVPAQAVGDVVRLREVLFSLLDNAVRFTERGEIVASVTSEPAPGGRVLLHAEISDTGVGIPAATMGLLFEGPRKRGDAASASETDAGGLPTACRLTELMDGRIGCSSAIGLGTTIWFTVPLDLPTA